LPVEEDLPCLAKPFSEEELKQAARLGKEWGIEQFTDFYPISFVGTGANLNEATTNGMERAATLLDITVPEVMNSATSKGSIDTGRQPGLVTVTFLAPKHYLENKGLLHVIKEQYVE